MNENCYSYKALCFAVTVPQVLKAVLQSRYMVNGLDGTLGLCQVRGAACRRQAALGLSMMYSCP
ncbi:hypothetical protein I79_002200 [Cricetulus griseus]|uniref:Uncharacterized protein n=1 Tax=Cricetulus griseus TaxID=10029 RepID=G3GWR9_CRIGR|nr:hypothetical protein I79_002200 [Cricetulus griseus]